VLQTDGGYLGSDFEAFFSAVVSGAAGIYVGVLLRDAGIETDLVVQPGQSVSVSGDPSLPRPPRWGGGSFTVQQRGSLTLQAVAVSSGLSVTNGGSAVLMACGGQLTSLTVMDSSFSMDAASSTTLGGSISLSNAGSVTLEDTTFAEGTELTVGGGTSTSLRRMEVPAEVLPKLVCTVGCVVRLSEATVTTADGTQWPQLQPGTLVASTGSDGALTLDPPAVSIFGWFFPVRPLATSTPQFIVNCTHDNCEFHSNLVPSGPQGATLH
jgi:hypothetical protein